METIRKLERSKIEALLGVLFSLTGLVASFWQAVERIHMLKNPAAPLSCDLNPVVDCGGVLTHNLSAIFGFPNALLGIVMFSILLTASLAWLFGTTTGAIRTIRLIFSGVAIAFSIWFFAVSLYIIGKICIFCVFIWASSVPLFVLALKDFLSAGNRFKRLSRLTRNFTLEIMTSIYVMMIFLYLYRFRDYYFS